MKKKKKREIDRNRYDENSCSTGSLVGRFRTHVIYIHHIHPRSQD